MTNNGYPNSKLILEMAILLTVNMYVNSTEIFNECMKQKPSSRYSNQLVWWGNLKNEIENVRMCPKF